MQGEQVEPDMSPLTRHEFTTLATALKLQVNSLDSKFSRLNKTTIHDEKRMNEEILTTHRLINSNDEYSKSNIRELERKEKETERKLEVIQSHLQMLLKTTNELVKDQNHQHARANNLEMKLRKRGGLSKEHAIDYVPYINLPDKHKRGAPSLPTPLSLSHKTRTTIASKYIVL